MMTREEAQAIYEAGPATAVRVLLEMDARIQASDPGQRTTRAASGRVFGEGFTQ